MVPGLGSECAVLLWHPGLRVSPRSFTQLNGHMSSQVVGEGEKRVHLQKLHFAEGPKMDELQVLQSQGQHRGGVRWGLFAWVCHKEIRTLLFICYSVRPNLGALTAKAPELRISSFVNPARL